MTGVRSSSLQGWPGARRTCTVPFAHEQPPTNARVHPLQPPAPFPQEMEDLHGFRLIDSPSEQFVQTLPSVLMATAINQLIWPIESSSSESDDEDW